MNEADLLNMKIQLKALIQYQNLLTQQVQEKLGAISILADDKLAKLSRSIEGMKDTMDTILPIGGIVMFSSENDYPDNFLDCDGTMWEVKEYPKLFDVIQRNFTPSSVNQEHFCVPDMRFRVPVCAGQHTPLDNDPRADLFDQEQTRLTERKVGETFGCELTLHDHTAYMARGKKDDFEKYIPRDLPKDVSGNGFTFPLRHWQPSIAMRFMIRAL